MVTIQIPASFNTAMSMTGYEPKTTFWMDFSIADRLGIEAIVDTLQSCFQRVANQSYLPPRACDGAQPQDLAVV